MNNYHRFHIYVIATTTTDSPQHIIVASLLLPTEAKHQCELKLHLLHILLTVVLFEELPKKIFHHHQEISVTLERPLCLA